MASVLRSIFPTSSARSNDRGDDDDYSVDYSFAVEYTGPPLVHDIPQVVPIDVRRIPTASVAARVAVLKNFSLPIIQPIVKSDHSKKNPSSELKSTVESHDLDDHLGTFVGSARIHPTRLEDGVVSKSNDDSGDARSLGSSMFSYGRDDSNRLSGSSDVEDLEDGCEANNNVSNSNEPREEEILCETSSDEDGENSIVQASSRGNRAPAVTFLELPPSNYHDTASEESEASVTPKRPVALSDGNKGTCHKCHKRNRFAEREFCIVCGAKYCKKCVIRAMGSMPEGRKCISCIGFRIDESKRGSLGKCTRMLRRMLTDDSVKQIMSSEVSCEVNQLPPHLVCVNDKPLSIEELVMLQSCLNPPKKLRPGEYWYDKVSGYWGKKGEKPCQIISPQLAIGYQIRQDCSNGDTNVMINNREITKAELWMLQAAGIHCEGSPHFWVTADGSYQHEGMKNVMGKLWEKRRVRLVCAALSLPFPSDTSNPGGEDVDKEMDKVNAKNFQQKMMNKLLLVGCDQSGTSTIFKQAKIVYNVPFTEDEKQNIKFVIQRNVYRYICILLEEHARFEEDYLIQMRRQRAEEPGPSRISEEVAESNIYSLSPRLKAFSDWLLQVMMSGNLEAIFPAATREYSPLVEELWKDKAFQATYNRRNELHMLPTAAHYFLDRAVEITQANYEPSQMDILCAEGITSSNGVASMEFSFPKSSQDGYMESLDQNDPSISYQLIRVHTSSLGENCKWLEMFEDVDLVIYCVSLTDYAEYYEDINGTRTNKMLAAKKFFETIAAHPTLTDKDFLLVLNKFDLLEEKIEQVPLSHCDWFTDFNPVTSLHPHSSNSNNNPPLAQRAFHYMAVKFKRLFASLTDRKLFVSAVNGLEDESVDRAIRYVREILKWGDEVHAVSMNNEWSSESMEPSTGTSV